MTNIWQDFPSQSHPSPGLGQRAERLTQVAPNLAAPSCLLLSRKLLFPEQKTCPHHPGLQHDTIALTTNSKVIFFKKTNQSSSRAGKRSIQLTPATSMVPHPREAARATQQGTSSASYVGICSVTAACSKEEPGLEDAPKDTIARVVGAGINREKEGARSPAVAHWSKHMH